jgi:hypothetical protein
MVSGIHRGDGGGIEYWMAKGGRGRERVSWVMKLGISDVSSVLCHSERVGERAISYLSATGVWVCEYHHERLR